MRRRRVGWLLLLAGVGLAFAACASYQTGPAGTTVNRVPGLGMVRSPSLSSGKSQAHDPTRGSAKF